MKVTNPSEADIVHLHLSVCPLPVQTLVPSPETPHSSLV